jgi:hypothetical protein
MTGPDFYFEQQVSSYMRFGALIGIYHGYDQGNPVCDGTLGNKGGPNGGPCPRTSFVTGQGMFIFRFTTKQSREGIY